MALAQASGALEDVLEYVKERKQFGKAIVEFQAVQLRLAEMAMRVDAARLLIWRAAANAEKGLPSILESSMAKCFANEIAREVTSDAVQLMGGYGYSKEYPMERRMRDCWGWAIAGGTIARCVVGIVSFSCIYPYDRLPGRLTPPVWSAHAPHLRRRRGRCRLGLQGELAARR